MAEAITSDAAVRKVLLGGSFYTGLAEAVAIVSGLATSLVAARVLSPRDFGLMATATLALSVLDHFSQSGFDAALVQRQDDVESYLDVAWTWQLLRGLVITLLLFAVALPMSRFYGEAVLLPLVMASALSSTIAGAANVGRIFFARKLDFRTLFFINAAQAGLKLAVFLPAVLILRNVWALVVGHLGGALLSLAISYIAHPYRPKLAFDRGKLRELLRFGKWVTMFAWIGFFITKGDDIFVSKYIGVAALGFYQLAYDISNLPTTKVTHVIGRIGLPIYARLVHDRELLRATFLKVMRATLLASALVSTAIYIAVPDIIAYVLGSKWAPVIPLVRIL
ncbi:MAG: oligosaccharide flippase family protein, partial [Myxococcota bacterium]